MYPVAFKIQINSQNWPIYGSLWGVSATQPTYVRVLMRWVPPKTAYPAVFERISGRKHPSSGIIGPPLVLQYSPN